MQGGIYQQLYKNIVKSYLPVQIKGNIECMDAQHHWKPIPEAPLQIPLSSLQGTFLLFVTLLLISCLTLTYNISCNTYKKLSKKS